MGIEEFAHKMEHQGFVIFNDVVDDKLRLRMARDVERAAKKCGDIQKKNGLKNTDGTSHHLIGQFQSFMDYLAYSIILNPYIEEYFGGKYIINSFGGNSLQKGSSYANHIHRDIRSFSGDIPLMLNTLVMLDPFTEENGATWILPGSHRMKDKPSKEYFYQNAIQATAPAGSILMFNSNLWHSAGENKTDKPRRSVTPLYSKPFFKQGYDYSQFYKQGMSPFLRQVLGYDARTPRTLHEWYQPTEKRMYKVDQG